MKKRIRIELEVNGRITDFSEYKITAKTTISSLLRKFKKFLEETN